MSENNPTKNGLDEIPADEKTTGELSTDQLEQVSGGSNGGSTVGPPSPHH